MGKIGVVGQSMDLYPRYLFFIAYVANQLCFFLAVCHWFFMAILAVFNIGNGGFLMGRNS